jgi:hypothetical protein
MLFALLFKHFPTLPATCHTPYFTNVCLIKDLEALQDKEINFSLFMYVIFIQLCQRVPEHKVQNSVPGPEEPEAVTSPARRSSEELRDPDILCSCLIISSRKLK